MPASSRPYRSALIRDEGSTRSAPPSTPMRLLLSGGLIAPMVFVGGFLAQGAIQPGYNPWTDYGPSVVLGVMGFGLIAAGAFQIDPTTARLTLHGELHYVASFVIAGSLGLAALLAWRDLRHAGRNPALASCCLATGFVVVTLFTASLLAPSVASPGLLERLALLAGSAWVVVYAQQLRRTLSVNRHEFERNLVAA